MVDIQRVGEGGPAGADHGVLAEGLLQFADLPGDLAPLLAVRPEQRFQMRLLFSEGPMLGPELDLLKLAQRTQAHVEDGFGLHVREVESRDQRGLGVVLLADDADDFIEIEIGDDVAIEHLEAPADLGKPVLRAADQHFLAVFEPGDDGLLEVHHLGDGALVEHVEIERDALLELAELEQLLHQDSGIDRSGAGLDDEADVVGALVANVLEQRKLFGQQQLGDLFDQLGLLHAIGDLGDDDLVDAASLVLAFPAGAQPEGAAAGLVGETDAGGVVDEDATGREIRAGDELHQLGDRG